MIDKRILSLFTQHNTQPYYIILLEKIEQDETVCNQESITISAKQLFVPLGKYINSLKQYIEDERIDPEEFNIEEYEEDLRDYFKKNDIRFVDRKLKVYSEIGVDDKNEYVGKLQAYVTEENTSTQVFTSENESSHYIEIIDINLQKEVEITFNREYTNQPHVNVTIDDNYRNLYRDISTDFVINEEGLYTGVKITFENLKSKNSYPDVGIMIIGDEKLDKHDEDGEIIPLTTEVVFHAFYKNNEKRDIPLKGVTIRIEKDEEEIISGETDDCGEFTVEKLKVLKENEEYVINTDNFEDETSGIIYSLEDSISFTPIYRKKNLYLELKPMPTSGE